MKLIPPEARTSRKIFLLVFGIILFLLYACQSRKPEKDSTAGKLPPEPGNPVVIVKDSRSDEEHVSWTNAYIIGGTWADLWFSNQYERPFSKGDMEYKPYLDITEARLRPAGDWWVFEVETVGARDQEDVYISLELDREPDGRADLLITSIAVDETTWDNTLVHVLEDQNHDVGGSQPRLAEPNNPEWDGFDFEGNTDAEEMYPGVFIRQSPRSPAAFQIAVDKATLGSDTYIWRVWLEGENFSPGWHEYNDYFTLEQAGSPYQYSENYPVKALALLDNTCLYFVGGNLQAALPGICETILELPSELQSIPDDLYVNTDGSNPIAIVFPEDDEIDETPEATLVPFNPGVYYKPSPTPYPILGSFPTLDFVEPPPTSTAEIVGPIVPTPEIAVAEIVTPEIAVAEIVTPGIIEAVPAPTNNMAVVDPTETEMFDPYQGATATPKPIFIFPTETPTATLLKFH